MLSYIYYGDYDDEEVVVEEPNYTELFSPTKSVKDPSVVKAPIPLVSHVSVNAIARQYRIPGLCMLAVQKIRSILRANWDAEVFCDFVTQCYDESDDDDLHNLAIEYAGLHAEDLLSRKDFNELDVPASFFRSMLRPVLDNTKAKSERIANEREAALTSKLAVLQIEKEEGFSQKFGNLRQILQVVGNQKTCYDCALRRGFRIKETAVGFIAACAHCGAAHPNRTVYYNPFGRWRYGEDLTYV